MTDKRFPDEPLPTRTESEGATVDLPEGVGFFSTGQVLGDRYEILEMLGRGGMGEVWRAFDLKLRVEVGLKALREDLYQSERRLELLRQEVRAAREVVSPNVCRIFDLIEIDGRELVSMEYVDGATLLGVLQERGPLELKEAQDIASQFLSGLEAIHKAGLVHRDVKPENIMLTRAGRVVVMDFGLARGPESGAGSVSGTPAYMAPEHAAGHDVDARADVYSAGVVLAEMVNPEGIKSSESRQSVWEGVRSEPAKIPDSPWAPVIKRAVARDRERRQNSAHTLIRELEDVTLRVEGAEDLHPYPGLASFTEKDAEFFFGREAEVERMWRKLERPPRMFGMVGPSGAGKTSFISAGLTAHAPPHWRIIRSTPGNAAIASLAAVVARETAGDPDTVALLPQFDSEHVAVEILSRWSGWSPHSLLVVDQFEELFTQNRDEEQRRFARLLERVVLEADVHILLVMRDDFVASCNTHEPLRPIFHELTVLDPLSGGNLRRALVQPAAKCGYRFEDDELVEEILTEVEGERGALPLLAFALGQLWEKRDRENGLLTRQAYHDIGGVGGALARHAEATVDRIGVERLPIVRELFRNLVTAEGTRAVREWDELLSVFGQPCHPEQSGLRGRGVEGSPSGRRRADVLNVSPKLGGSFDSLADSVAQDDKRGAASEVFLELIDARLLTSYEVREDEHEPIRRVEIIHESLLANWPRLVRWQTQDADAVQLREQLRQAAKTWDEHNRTDDLLWTGATYREFASWRERYPGGLTDVENDFTSEMTSFATRRKRRRRIVAAAAVGFLTIVAIVLSTLWRRSVNESLRAEAGKLLALAQTRVEDDPTAALAYVRASLMLADTSEARRMAVGVLWRGPVARILPVKKMAEASGLPVDPSPVSQAEPSTDGRWLATVTGSNRQILLFPSDGGPPRTLPRQPDGNVRVLAFGPQGESLVTGGTGESLRFWSLPELRELGGEELGGERSHGFVRGDNLYTRTSSDVLSDPGVLRVRSMPTGEPRAIDGRLPSHWPWDLDPTGTLLAEGRDRTILVRPLNASGPSEERVLGEAGDRVQQVRFAPGGKRVASLDRSGEIRIWSTIDADGGPLSLFRGPRYQYSRTRFDPTGRFVSQVTPTNAFLVWDSGSPPDSEPRIVRRRDSDGLYSFHFDPLGHWAVTDFGEGMVEFWSIETPWARTFTDVSSTIWSMAFTNDGRLATCPMNQPVHLRTLTSTSGEPRRLAPAQPCICLAANPNRNEILVGTNDGKVLLCSPSEDSCRTLPGRFEWEAASPVAFDVEGRRAAAGPYGHGRGIADPKDRVIRIWDLESGAERIHSVAHLTDADWDSPNNLGFAYDGSLYASLGKGGRLMRLTLPDDSGGEISAETVFSAALTEPNLSRDGRFMLVHASETPGSHNFRFEQFLIFDLVEGTSRRIATHGSRLFNASQIDQTNRILVTGDLDGVVRAGPITGEEPHLLLGHTGGITSLAISPDSRWIASADDTSVRLWPMPDVTKPPLHTVPLAELLAKLDTFTNLRAVRDPESSTGWTLEVGSFPGWETVPTW